MNMSFTDVNDEVEKILFDSTRSFITTYLIIICSTLCSYIFDHSLRSNRSSIHSFVVTYSGQRYLHFHINANYVN